MWHCLHDPVSGHQMKYTQRLLTITATQTICAHDHYHFCWWNCPLCLHAWFTYTTISPTLKRTYGRITKDFTFYLYFWLCVVCSSFVFLNVEYCNRGSRVWLFWSHIWKRVKCKLLFASVSDVNVSLLALVTLESAKTWQPLEWISSITQ